MTKKKWLIVIALGMAACATMCAIVFVVWFIRLDNMGVDHTLPVYTFEQIPSIHPGYRRTTITSGTSVYVNDFDEYALRLENTDPTHAIGRTPFGGGKIYAIPGQKPTAYVAADVGSEMSAYAVFRNSQLPPFDWRTATFQKMEFTWPNGSGANERTTDPALIEDVVRTLRDGTPTNLPTPVSGSISNLSGLHLFSDQLPGLIYCLEVYPDKAGPVYLAENMVVETANSKPWVQARWVPASLLFTKWVQTP